MFLSVCSPQILERQIEAGTDLVAHRPRHRDTAGRSDALQPRRDVDAVAENVVVLDDHVAEIDAGAQLDPPVRGYVGVASSHFALLDFRGAGDRAHYARELHQHPVAGELYDAAAQCSAILGSISSARCVFNAASMQASSISMRRL